MGKETIKIDQTKEPKENEKKLRCGIVMPIAGCSEYPQEHWKDVLHIITEAVRETDFEVSLVSEAPDVGLIHDRIVTNLYSNEIVICDVSSKNPNVMFELGLRLAFDKPTIIIKDEKTGYSFDTGVIEHMEYPSSLRFSQIIQFKKELVRRIKATYDASQNDEHYSPFLKNYGQRIIPRKVEGKEITESKFIMDSLEELSKKINILTNSKTNYRQSSGTRYAGNLPLSHLRTIRQYINEYVFKSGVFNSTDEIVSFHKFLTQNSLDYISLDDLKTEIKNMGFYGFGDDSDEIIYSNSTT